MNKLGVAVIAGSIGVLALSACKQEAAAAPVDVRAAMQNGVNPATLAIWDVGNNAMNDDGGIDPAKMDEAKWTRLADAAGQLSAAAKGLGAGTTFIASNPDNAEVAEGEIAMAQVQAHLDANPDGFAEMARALAAHADKIAAAAKAKDAPAAGALVSQIDQVCESCHTAYWYPEQQ